jgi:iron complex outermembrane recepter protein
MKQISYFFALLFWGNLLSAQTISGIVSDATNGSPVVGATVLLKGTASVGAATKTDGSFSFSIKNTRPPFILVISSLGFEQKEVATNDFLPLKIQLSVAEGLVEQVVVSASRVEESILRSPVTVEKLDALAIKNTPAVSFYDGLVFLKSLDMVTSSITYKQINARGFNDTGNSRFLQLIDGVDNQSAGLGFAVGNLFGAADLDVESVELVPGAASALYGPVAFNGMLSMKTKNPFTTPGFSTAVKIGANHFGDNGGAKPYTDLSLRWAKAFSNRFAVKLTGNLLKATDWYANDFTDIDPQTPVTQQGDANPARNALNIYGDEVTRTIDGVGRISRTGYEEKDVAQYGSYGGKIGLALHYKLTENIEAIAQTNFSQGTTMYTGSSRYGLNNFKLYQNRLELRSKKWFVRTYSTAERSTDSYNSRSLAQHINRTWVKDSLGQTVAPNLADAAWFARYEDAYKGTISGVAGQNHAAARAFADAGRLVPGSSDYEREKARLIKTTGLSGSGVLSNSTLYHVDAQYDLSENVRFFDLLVGGNYRFYDMNSEGTLFDDINKKITVGEYGVFAQASKSFFEQKIKATISGRWDKNESFEGNFTPRASFVFSPTKAHHVRVSYQTGFRNPTVPDQYINLNVGPIIILGGAPSNIAGTNAYENSVYASSLGAFFGNFQQELMSGTAFPDAVVKSKDKLVKSKVAALRPEQTTGYEVGYRGFFGKKWLLDANFHYSTYTNFLINTVVMRTDSPLLLPDGTINPAAAFDIVNSNTQLYQLYTNAPDKAAAKGATVGLTYALPKNYRIGANTTWADFDLKNANPDNIPAFNTPKWKANFSLANDYLTEKIGFAIGWHWQQKFNWYGTLTQLAPGEIKSFNQIDAQVSYHIPKLKTTVKLGANNISNQKIVTAYGSPAQRGLYFLGLTFDDLLR